jgi:hypothetical protein
LWPPAQFAAGLIEPAEIEVSQFVRIRRKGGDPLEFVHGEGPFNAPAREFCILYAANTLACCLAEAVIRDRYIPVERPVEIAPTELATREVVELGSTRPLRLIDLSGPGALRQAVPPDVAKGADYALSRAWSLALWAHPALPEGVLYRSRFDDDFLCVAIYDRARSALTTARTMPLSAHPDLAAVLDRYRIALV